MRTAHKKPTVKEIKSFRREREPGLFSYEGGAGMSP
jgi:hypothetical protein